MTNRFISQPLAFDALQGDVRARHVVNAPRNAVRMPEIKFGGVAMQVLFGAMLIDADHASFEHAVIAFNAVGVDVSAGLSVGVWPAAGFVDTGLS